MTYIPPQEILERYASVLVDFALGGGEGVQPGEVVRVVAPESAKPLYVELQKAVWRAGGHVIGSYQPDDDHSFNLSRDFYELAERRAARSLSREVHARPDRRDRPPGLGDRGGRSARPGLGRPGEDHAQGRDAAPAAGLARREGERGALHVDARPLRHGGDGGRGGHGRGGVLGADRARVLPRRAGPDRPLARGGGASGADARAPRRAADRATARRGRGRRPVDHRRRAAPLARRERPQHPELRDLHEPRLARHGGLDLLQPAALPLREHRAGHPPARSPTGA